MAQLLEPLRILESNNSKCIIVMLNRPLNPDLKLIKFLWNKSVYKLSVDGGTNELYDHLSKNDESYIPDLISGDFDSMRPGVKEFFENKGVEIVSTPDQNYTDFTKALQLLAEKMKLLKMNASCVIILGAFGGRLDQIFANIDTLFHFDFSIPIYLMSENNLAVLLKEGSYKISVKSSFREDWCGLVPMGEPCESVFTTGLKWNLNKQRLKFGELISTSNTYESDQTESVEIETDKPLLWTMGYSQF